MAALKDEAKVEAILRDPTSAAMDARLRAMLAFLEKVVHGKVTEADAAALRAAGVTDAAAEDALFVTFAFEVMDRLADSFGFTLTRESDLPKVGKMLLRIGYARASVPG